MHPAPRFSISGRTPKALVTVEASGPTAAHRSQRQLHKHRTRALDHQHVPSRQETSLTKLPKALGTLKSSQLKIQTTVSGTTRGLPRSVFTKKTPSLSYQDSCRYPLAPSESEWVLARILYKRISLSLCSHRPF